MAYLPTEKISQNGRDTEDPPTEQEARSPIHYQSSSFHFRDGSVVLLAGDTALRVHITGPLILFSGVCSMFADVSKPTDWTIEHKG